MESPQLCRDHEESSVEVLVVLFDISDLSYDHTIIKEPQSGTPSYGWAKYDPFGAIPAMGCGSARQIFGEPLL